MTIFKHKITCLLGAFISCAPWAQAETIELVNGDTLSGEVRSLTKETLTLVSPVSYQPLKINSEVVKSIFFTKDQAEKATHGERLTLSNGDVIPCQVLSLDDNQLKISTWYAGDFVIPRKQIESLQFGIRDQKIIYRGIDAVNDWSTHDGRWSKSGNTYTCQGSGTLARKLELPENLRISFVLAWKGSPNFAFRFCGESDSATTKQDTYEFLFNSAGMQIRRYEDNNQPGAPLANIPLKPLAFSGRKANIDLHINRKEGIVSLFIDNNQIGSWPDPFKTSHGNYIIFNNRSSKNQLSFTDITVTGINDGTLPRHREAIKKAQSDVMIDSTGEKLSGNILRINQGESNKRSVHMKLKFDSKAITIPDRRVSSLFFSQPEQTVKSPKASFIAMLVLNGQLQLSNPRFLDGAIEAKHPILGSCKIDAKALIQLKKPTTQKSTEEKSSESSDS